MTAVIVAAAVAAVGATVAFRRRPRHRAHPIQHRPTIDFDELRAMWPGDIGGYE